MHTFELNLRQLTKVEGSASLDIRVKENKVEYVHFKVTEFKRFYTQAMRGKPIAALPQLLARICGTCSNAHLLCSIESGERALGIQPSPQTLLLRILMMYGLMIRDHALHLYLFALPDLYQKDSFLELNEHDPEEHQLLHDGFAIKAAGNSLATIIGGRSVHATYPVMGGFIHFPGKNEVNEVIEKLESVRDAAVRLIDVFRRSPFHFDRTTHFMALISDRYGFLNGCIQSDSGRCIPEEGYRVHLEQVVLPYSQASAYESKGEPYMVGALARMNLSKEKLHINTRKTLKEVLDLFPSTDIFHNNLAQAIEILHCIDDALDILRNQVFQSEPLVKKIPQGAIGIGVIEAPRGTLYHKVEIGGDGIVKRGEIVVPTGQNQINIEKDVAVLVERLLPHTPKEEIVFEIEKLIRAYDPCMSCAAHFLQVNWRKTYDKEARASL